MSGLDEKQKCTILFLSPSNGDHLALVGCLPPNFRFLWEAGGRTDRVEWHEGRRRFQKAAMPVPMVPGHSLLSYVSRPPSLIHAGSHPAPYASAVWNLLSLLAVSVLGELKVEICEVSSPWTPQSDTKRKYTKWFPFWPFEPKVGT